MSEDYTWHAEYARQHNTPYDKRTLADVIAEIDAKVGALQADVQRINDAFGAYMLGSMQQIAELQADVRELREKHAAQAQRIAELERRNGARGPVA